MTKPAEAFGAQIAAQISPLIEQHLAEERAKLKPRVVFVADPDVMSAAERISDALTKLDEVKYTRGEIRAREAVIRQARAIRTILERMAKR